MDAVDKFIDLVSLYDEVLGDEAKSMLIPPPSFNIMEAKILKYDANEKSIIVKMPVLERWLNPYSTMQGGIIIGAIDNAVGPLSLLIAPKNMTRHIDSKLLKAITMEIKYIYVKAKLIEQKKSRLIFEAVLEDEFGEIYAKAKLTNFII